MSALDKAQRIARNELPLDVASPELSQSLIRAALEKFERDHATSVQLKKSTELNAYIRLLDEELIYPSGRLLAERLDLCIEILQRCPQRPVLEQVALTLLELDLRHRWTTSHAHLLEKILDIDTKQSRHRTIPMLALCMHHSRAFATDFATRIAESNLTQKKIRVGELIETLYILPEEEPLNAFVELAYEAIFAKTSPADKIELLSRVIRECFTHERVIQQDIWNHIGGDPRAVPRALGHERWTLLIDPIISQNLQHVEVVEMLSLLMDVLPQEHATRYLTNYTMSMAQHRRMLTDRALDLLEEHAGANLIPYLYPSTQLTERTLLVTRKTPYATRVEQIIEAIISREQLDRNAGGLSLSEQSSGGGLTVLDASHGTLSIDAASTNVAKPALDPSTLLPPIHQPMTRDVERAPHAKLDKTRLAMMLTLIVLLTMFFIYHMV